MGEVVNLKDYEPGAPGVTLRAGYVRATGRTIGEPDPNDLPDTTPSEYVAPADGDCA